METTLFGQATLFRSGRMNLEKKFIKAAKETQDTVFLTQCAIAIMVRNGLSVEDFSYFCKDIIREWFLTDDSLKEIPMSCVYFRDYFSDEEWATLTKRMFGSEKAFLTCTEYERMHIDKLGNLLISGSREVPQKSKLVSVFKDENGKRHGWNLSNVNPQLTNQQYCDLLTILTKLDIFEKDGVRRFAEVVKADTLTEKPRFNNTKEEQTLKAAPLRSIITKPTELSKVAQTPQNRPSAPIEAVINRAAESRKQTPQELEIFLLGGFDYSSVPDENELLTLVNQALAENKPVTVIQKEQKQIDKANKSNKKTRKDREKSKKNRPQITKEQRAFQNRVNKALGKKKRSKKRR